MGDWIMKHEEILNQLVTNAKNNPNILGFLVFRSVATGTHRENSDIDIITVLQTNLNQE
jgi:predicted nucleotidyltransferase